MEPLLFVCHRIPYPANKGDKITTFNLMKYLHERYDLYLGCFIDDPVDKEYKDDVCQFCKEAFFVDIVNRSQFVSGITSIIKNQPVSLSHYDSKQMQTWVDNTISKYKINKLFVYSSGMAQFIESDRYKKKTRVLDMADVDSDKWLQYAGNKPFYSRWIYHREHRLLNNYEQNLLKKFQIITLITDEERDFFQSLSPIEMRGKIKTLSRLKFGQDRRIIEAELRRRSLSF